MRRHFNSILRSYTRSRKANSTNEFISIPIEPIAIAHEEPSIMLARLVHVLIKPQAAASWSPQLPHNYQNFLPSAVKTPQNPTKTSSVGSSAQSRQEWHLRPTKKPPRLLGGNRSPVPFYPAESRGSRKSFNLFMAQHAGTSLHQRSDTRRG